MDTEARLEQRRWAKTPGMSNRRRETDLTFNQLILLDLVLPYFVILIDS